MQRSNIEFHILILSKANVYFGLTDVSCSITEKRNLAVLLNFLFSNFI